MLLVLYVCSEVSVLKCTEDTLLRVSDILRQLTASARIYLSSVHVQLLASLALALHSLTSDSGLCLSVFPVFYLFFRVTSCLEYHKMSGNLKHVRVKNLVVEKCPKLFIAS